MLDFLRMRLINTYGLQDLTSKEADEEIQRVFEYHEMIVGIVQRGEKWTYAKWKWDDDDRTMKKYGKWKKVKPSTKYSHFKEFRKVEDQPGPCIKWK